MALGVLLFCQSDVKRCALAGVFLAALAGTGIAEYWFKDARAVPWYWVGPLAVGAIGYLMNYFTGNPDGVQTGYLTGAFASLARPIPLDYASAGMAGAIVGALDRLRPRRVPRRRTGRRFRRRLLLPPRFHPPRPRRRAGGPTPVTTTATALPPETPGGR